MPLTLDIATEPYGEQIFPAPAVKTCAKCGETKALEAFSKNAKGRLGRRADCKVCRNADNRRWHAANAAAEREYSRRYREANAEAKREYNRCYYEANAEARREYNHSRRHDPETRPAYLAANRLANHRRRAILHGAETDNHSMEDLLAYWDDEGIYMCVDCGGPLDDGYEIDHVMPLIRGGSDTVDNKVPLCKPCHGPKNDRCPYEYYASRYESLAPYLAPFINVRPKLTEDEIQARVNTYEARDSAA